MLRLLPWLRLGLFLRLCLLPWLRLGFFLRLRLLPWLRLSFCFWLYLLPWLRLGFFLWLRLLAWLRLSFCLWLRLLAWFCLGLFLGLCLLAWLRLGLFLGLCLLPWLRLSFFLRLRLLPWLCLLLFGLGLLFVALLLLSVNLDNSSGKRNKGGQGHYSKKFHVDPRFFGIFVDQLNRERSNVQAGCSTFCADSAPFHCLASGVLLLSPAPTKRDCESLAQSRDPAACGRASITAHSHQAVKPSEGTRVGLSAREALAALPAMAQGLHPLQIS